MNRYPYLLLDVPVQEAELAALQLWELGVSGLEEQDVETLERCAEGTVRFVAHFAQQSLAQTCLEQLPAHWQAKLQFIEGDEWRDAWKRFFKAQAIGQRLYLRPSWEPSTEQAGVGRVQLVIDPGRAFGSGMHASTQLLLQAIDALVKGDEQVLDLGSGSGILSIAALLLGAKKARAVDIDADTVAVAQQNAEVNGVAKQLHADATPIDELDGEYDLVLANIQAEVHLLHAQKMSSLVKSGGALLLSGLLVEQEPEIRAAFAELDLEQRLQNDEQWIALVYRKGKRNS